MLLFLRDALLTP